MIYLASPYSHPDAAVREQRYHATCSAAAQLINAGHAVFAPIVQGHALVPYGLPTCWSYWEPHAKQHLQRCDELVVLTLDGWDTSEGVQAEITLAHGLGMSVYYMAQRLDEIVLTIAPALVPS